MSANRTKPSFNPSSIRPPIRLRAAIALFLLTSTVAAAGTQQARPVGPNHNPLQWKVGDRWFFRVNGFKVDGEEFAYGVHVTVAGKRRVGSTECWRVALAPTNAPQSVGWGFDVLLDRNSGSLVQVRRRADNSLVDTPITPGVPISVNPPAGIPFEVLPLLAQGETRSSDGKTLLRVIKSREGNSSRWEAVLTREGGKRLVIRELWADGQKWWREYERVVDGRTEFQAKFDAEPPPNKKLVPPLIGRLDPFKLQQDPRLHARLSVDEQSPELEDVLNRVRRVTGVRLTVDPALASHAPAFGTVGWRNLPAWSAMEAVAHTGLEEGRWEKDGDGYVLRGKSISPQAIPLPQAVPVPSPPITRWLVITLMPLLLIVLGILALSVRRSARNRPETTSRGEHEGVGT